MPTPHYGQPRYRVIADALRERIENGGIPAGALLPTESALTAEFRAARGTIRQAIGILREAGWVSTEHGRGSYANPRPPEGGPAESSVVRQRQITADPDLADLFGVAVGTTLDESTSITRAEGAVRSVTRTYQLLSAAAQRGTIGGD
ncbi:GntR family transcriptional regulator [Micromonospora taraxaci]|uniref:GntR family transcriptional regulator n=1 Tax=Micromonospora taraxaci TaxID=1316803 RepID=UPI00340D69B4